MRTNSSNRKSIVTGRVLSGLFVLFMLGASIAPKLLFPEAAGAYAIMDQLGWPRGMLLLIAIIELAGTVLYLLPRTNVLGAVLMTALLGGAVAAHLRVASPLFSHTLFGMYLGLVMWGGLWMRDPILRGLLPLRRTQSAVNVEREIPEPGLKLR